MSMTVDTTLNSMVDRLESLDGVGLLSLSQEFSCTVGIGEKEENNNREQDGGRSLCLCQI